MSNSGGRSSNSSNSSSSNSSRSSSSSSSISTRLTRRRTFLRGSTRLPPPQPQGNSGMSFGGSLDCGSLERDSEPQVPWSLVARRAKSKFDMRPVKTVKRFANPCCQGKSCIHSGSICSIDRDMQGGSISAVDRFRGSWERVPVTVDSGAIDSVIPSKVAAAVPTRDTEASRRGLKYRAANGSSILNRGEKTIKGYTNEANLVDMSMQVCDVTKPLGSVRAMLQAGNRVVFDQGG